VARIMSATSGLKSFEFTRHASPESPSSLALRTKCLPPTLFPSEPAVLISNPHASLRQCNKVIDIFHLLIRMNRAVGGDSLTYTKWEIDDALVIVCTQEGPACPCGGLLSSWCYHYNLLSSED